MKVSIIIPVYNVEDYLKVCLDSVINQTYKNLEIIVVNDGSTDGCEKISYQYKNSDQRIKYIYQDNAGLSAARNTGIDNSTGDFLFFLDSDDYIDSKTIEILCNDIMNEDADIVICGHNKVYDNDCRGIINDEITIFEGGDRLNSIYEDCQNDVIISCAKLYRKTLFENVRFPVGRYHEDEFTTYKLLYNSKKIVSDTSVLYMYRQREGSIMHNEKINVKSHIDALDAIEESVAFFEDKGVLLYKRMVTRYFFMMKVILELFYENHHFAEYKKTKKRLCLEWKKYKNNIENTYNKKIVYCILRINVRLANYVDVNVKRLDKLKKCLAKTK